MVGLNEKEPHSNRHLNTGAVQPYIETECQHSDPEYESREKIYNDF